VAATIFLLVLSLAVLAVGLSFVRTAKRMRTFTTTRGRVVERELALVGGDQTEGRWGRGGGYRPKVTYTYEVDGTSYTSDRSGLVHRGLKKTLAEEALAAIPDEVDVYYDPAAPQEAFLETSTPRVGRFLIAGGGCGVVLSLLILLGG